jgi:hypothetical protein
MTKIFLSFALIASSSVAFALEGLDHDREGAAIRSRSALLDSELTRARRVLKGKGGITTDFSMSFDMSYPHKEPKKEAAPKLPKKKVHTASKQGMAKLSKAPTPPKQPKASKSIKGESVSHGAKGPMAKAPKMDEIFPPDMSMSMSMATAAPSVSLEAPTAAPSATVETDSMPPVARRRQF